MRKVGLSRPSGPPMQPPSSPPPPNASLSLPLPLSIASLIPLSRILLSASAGTNGVLKKMVVTTDPTRRRPAQCAPLLPSDTIHGGRANPDYNLDEPTMEEKLATLNLPNKNNETASDDARDQPPSMVMVVPPSADSVHVLLKQALRADDHASLLNCLYNRDDRVIVKSIALLTPSDAVKLLKFFIMLMQSRGAVLVCLLPWLQTLLSRHMSSIVSQESSLVLLNSLYQLIDARMSTTFKSALQLSTCLDCLFSEIVDGESDEEEGAPLIIYVDKETDEEESEVDDMETDGENEEDLGDVTDAFEHSDGSEDTSD